MDTDIALRVLRVLAAAALATLFLQVAALLYFRRPLLDAVREKREAERGPGARTQTLIGSLFTGRRAVLDSGGFTSRKRAPDVRRSLRNACADLDTALMTVTPENDPDMWRRLQSARSEIGAVAGAFDGPRGKQRHAAFGAD